MQKTTYPLRLEREVRDQAEKLAASQERSLNWQLNELVKLGLAQLAREGVKHEAAHG